MIRHIIKILWAEKRQNIMLFVELLLVMICFWYIADSLYTPFKISSQPTGFNIDHVYRVYMSAVPERSHLYKKPDHPEYLTAGAALLSIRDRLRALPEVETVSISHNSTPHQGNNRTTNFSTGKRSIRGVMIRAVEPSFFDLFGIYDKEGNNEEYKRLLYDPKRIVVSPSVVQYLFNSNENPIGQQIYTDRDTLTIGAVTHELRQNTYYGWNLCYFAPIVTNDNKWLEFDQISSVSFIELMIRVRPEADHNFEEHFVQQIAPRLNVGNIIISGVKSVTDLRDAHDMQERNDFKLKGLLFLFFAVNVLLGTLGVFWYRTEERKQEMGIRTALGAHPGRLLRFYLLEGLMLLCFALPLAIAAMWVLWHYELLDYYWTMDLSRALITGGVTFVLLALMVMLGIWLPVSRTLKTTSLPSTLKDE